MIRAAIQIGLLHMAVAMTLVPINSTLNRVMIKELGLSATLVVLLFRRNARLRLFENLD
jgi:BCD family chlorophyll transporter-like MFS transporter